MSGFLCILDLADSQAKLWGEYPVIRSLLHANLLLSDFDSRCQHSRQWKLVHIVKYTSRGHIIYKGEHHSDTPIFRRSLQPSIDVVMKTMFFYPNAKIYLGPCAQAFEHTSVQLVALGREISSTCRNKQGKGEGEVLSRLRFLTPSSMMRLYICSDESHGGISVGYSG